MDDLLVTLKKIISTVYAHNSAVVICACMFFITSVQATAQSNDSVNNTLAQLKANKVITWEQGQNRKWLLMNGEVNFSIGSYGFEAQRAVVRIDSIKDDDKKAHKIWIYFDQVRPTGSENGAKARAPRLLTTVTTTGDISLEADSLVRSSKTPDDKLIKSAKKHIKRRGAIEENNAQDSAASYLHQSISKSKSISNQDIASQSSINSSDKANVIENKKTDNSDNYILPKNGSVHFGFDRIVVKKLKDKIAVMLIGNVRFLYEDDKDKRAISLKADRAVLFLSNSQNKKNGKLSSSEDKTSGKSIIGDSVDASKVKGIYLEDHAVVSNGEYTLRSPRIYYNLMRNKAVLLNAVFYTYNVKLRIPLYIRAQKIAQQTAGSFSAKGASFTSSAFATPFMAIHADSLKLTSELHPNKPTEHHFEAKNITMNVEGHPTLVWPKLAGSDGPQAPLQAVTLGRSSDDGIQFKTKWDLFSLAGVNVLDGVNLTGNIDYRGFHGPGVGVDLDYKRPKMHGNFKGYVLPHDTGTDKIANRQDVGHSADLRGFFHFQHRQNLSQGWQLSLEAADVSDPTFLEKFFESEAYATRPYETSFFLKKKENDWDISLLAKGRLSDFLPQTNLLQSRGFSVDKLAQLSYRRTGTSLFDGLFTWFSENSVSRLRARFDKRTPGERGFSAAQSNDLFGIGPNTSFASAAAAANYPTDWYARLDSRQEIDMPMKVGFVDVTPYVAGRLTAYDDDFRNYNGGNTQNIRLWGQVGARLHTQFHNTYNINSDLLNLHKLRHIIEPNIDMFTSGTTLSNDNLPIYDPDVEGISTGTGIKIGMTNTFQTQRGGEGRWRNVDWLSLKTYLVLYNHTNGANEPFPHYFSYRPEYSFGGNHFYTQLKWMASDSLGFTGELTDSLESNKIVQWRISATMDHSPNLSSFISYQELAPLNSHLLSYGLGYKLTPKYYLGISQSIDLSHSDSQRVDAWLQRDFDQFKLRLVGSFDSLEGDTSIGIEIMPKGMEISHLVPDIFTQHNRL